MKKLLWAVSGLAWALIACTGNNTSSDTGEEQDSDRSDVFLSDTLTREEVEGALPARADEIFDDFLFNYSQDSTVQLRRTAFPLPYIKNGRKKTIARARWQKDPLFSNMEFYSVLYDKATEMQLEKDTSLQRVQMEYLYLNKKEAKRYSFLRNPKGYWILCKITEEPFTPKEDPLDFLEFYEKFANDSVYQREHVPEHLQFVTFDPDDEFRKVTCDITQDQWFAYRPKLPLHTLTQIKYGQAVLSDHRKIVNFRGNSNGFNNTLTFEKKNHEWMLVSYEDTSE